MEDHREILMISTQWKICQILANPKKISDQFLSKTYSRKRKSTFRPLRFQTTLKLQKASIGLLKKVYPENSRKFMSLNLE